MADKVLVNPKYILKIYLSYKERASIYFTEGEKKKTIFFGLIVTKKAMPAGWVDLENFTYPLETKSLEEILKNNKYYSDADNKIWIRPYIKMVYANEKADDIVYFNTSEEVDKYVNDLIKNNDLKLEVLYIKKK